MTSKDFRCSPLVLRNEFPATSLGMPILSKVSLPRIDDIISYHDTRPSDKRALKKAYLVLFLKTTTSLSISMKSRVAALVHLL